MWLLLPSLVLHCWARHFEILDSLWSWFFLKRTPSKEHHGPYWKHWSKKYTESSFSVNLWSSSHTQKKFKVAKIWLWVLPFCVLQSVSVTSWTRSACVAEEWHFCETQLIQTEEDLAGKGGQTDVIILDFTKAFYMVQYKHLLLKLDFCGIRGKTNRWIEDFFSNRSQQIVAEGKHSSQAQSPQAYPKALS